MDSRLRCLENITDEDNLMTVIQKMIKSIEDIKVNTSLLIINLSRDHEILLKKLKALQFAINQVNEFSVQLDKNEGMQTQQAIEELQGNLLSEIKNSSVPMDISSLIQEYHEKIKELYPNSLVNTNN